MAKRRANGEGSIVKRTDKKTGKVTWQAQYTNFAGERKTLYGKTQKEVKDKLKEAIRHTDKGISTDADKIMFTDWLVDWLEVYEKPNIKRVSYSNYYFKIHQHIVPGLQGVSLKALSVDHLQRFFNEKAENGRIDGEGGLGAATTGKMKKLIIMALDQAIENKLLTENVAKKVKIPRPPKGEVQVLTREEQKKLEQTVEEKENAISFGIILALYTGLRIGELVALRLEDFDLEKKELHVRRTQARYQMPGEERKTERAVTTPKTPTSNRTIPLPDFFIPRVQRFIDERNARVKATDGRWAGTTHQEAAEWKDEGWLFVTARGTCPDRTTMRAELWRRLKDAGLPRFKFHALRHTFATRCIEQGFDVKTLSAILGHSDASITLNTYVHALEDQRRTNMNKLAELYSGEDEKEE